jgi:hypothetical protein
MALAASVQQFKCCGLTQQRTLNQLVQQRTDPLDYKQNYIKYNELLILSSIKPVLVQFQLS